VSLAEDRTRLAALGLWVRVVRVTRRWSQEQLAAAAGLDRTCVTRLELGRHAPTVITVRRLAGALGMSLAELLDGPPPGGGRTPPHTERKHPRQNGASHGNR
jgi:transcriptional regulator with XRE-family HTH domain